MAANPFLGFWHIESMELWEPEWLNMVVHAFIEFEKQPGGEFLFGIVSGGLDYCVSVRGTEPLAEWSWEGVAENDPACGRGWALLRDGSLTGRFYIHGSDDSAFVAVRPGSREQRMRAGIVRPRTERRRPVPR